MHLNSLHEVSTVIIISHIVEYMYSSVVVYSKILEIELLRCVHSKHFNNNYYCDPRIDSFCYMTSRRRFAALILISFLHR